MDNYYFSSVKLFLELKEMEILASGTIRANRLLGCQLKTEKQMEKEGRGCTDHKVSEEGNIVLVRWQDNGVVNMASTHVETGNAGKTKTKKWTVREIAHFASFSLANSWLEYVRDADKERLLKKNTMGMLAFQTNVTHSLITCNKMAQKKRGRPSNESPQPVAKKAHNTEPPPTNTVRAKNLTAAAGPTTCDDSPSAAESTMTGLLQTASQDEMKCPAQKRDLQSLYGTSEKVLGYGKETLLVRPTTGPSGKDKKVKVNTTMIFPRELALLLGMVSKEVLKPQQWLVILRTYLAPRLYHRLVLGPWTA
ncbi:hypothetical protein HPB47_015522 [Ixodes persulcatus]|uniref:Uncharacterized protein n=1 Tax=Ixodes persulcatus TaxID=34615 RepID=A0AC60QTA7_IXOPE|nr:hypothetical protein HPB47_015522 [Ixodes persulcatus]